MKAPPYPVKQALKRLGDNLRTTRIRRNHTIEEVAEKIGTGRRAVMDAEKGKACTGMGVSMPPCCGSLICLRRWMTSRIPPRTSKGSLLPLPKRRRVRKSAGLGTEF
jgi:DNA-binding XRE family transcriptional regulator